MDRKQSALGLACLWVLILPALSACGSSGPSRETASEPTPPPREQTPPSKPSSPPIDSARKPNVYFHVRWDGEYIAGDITVRGLVRRTNVVESRTGGGSNAVRTSPSTSVYESITLLREPGVDNAFHRWAEKVFSVGKNLGSQMALGNYRKTIVIEVFDAASSNRINAYRARRCWPSEHAPAALPPGPKQRSSSQEFRERLVLECDTWERIRPSD